MRELGIDRVRITASWSSLTRAPEEETKPEGFDAADPGAYEQARWAGLDTAIRAIRAAGLKALVDIGFWAPHWATDDPPGPRARSNIDPQAYADFATAVALRYSGAFRAARAGRAPARADRGREPHRAASSSRSSRSRCPTRRCRCRCRPAERPAGRPGARRARRGRAAAEGRPLHHLERAQPPGPAAAAVEGRRPDARQPRRLPRDAALRLRGGQGGAQDAPRVLIGNTSSTGGERGKGPVPPLEFLRELACVDAQLKPRTGGDCEGFTQLPGDGWAHHPYSQNERPERVSDPKKEPGDLRLADTPVLARTLDRLVKLGRLAPANRNIHLTEFGYETKGIPGRPRVNETQQARWMTWAEYLADRVPTVRSFAQFLLRDQPPAPVRVSQSDKRPFGEYSTGLLHVDGSEKVIARTFLAGIFAQRQADGQGARLRAPAPRRRSARSSSCSARSRAAPGRAIGRLSIDGRHSFQRTFAHRAGASYRITYPGPAGKRRSGLAIKPVPAPR